MAYTVADLKYEVSGILQGLSLDTTVTNLNGAIERAARVTLQQADVPEASGIYPFVAYDQVYDYAAPDTIYGTTVSDLRPQGVPRNPGNYAYKQPTELFDRNKQFVGMGNKVAFDFRNGTPIMRVTTPIPRAVVVIDPMNAIGTSPNQWVAAGTASGLAVDQTNFYQSPASLRFTQTVGIGTLTKTLTNSLSLSDYEDVGVAFLAINTPSATDLTSIALRLGSDSGNYDEVSSTTGFVSAWWANDWLLVAFDFAGATSTGTPDWSALDYVQVRITGAATLTNFRAGYLQMGLPSPVELLYQTSAIFLPAGSGTPIKTITLDTDTVLLSDPAFTILTYESAKNIYLQSGGGMGDKMYQTIQDTLHGEDTGLYPKYRSDNPSQELRSVDYYYD